MERMLDGPATPLAGQRIVDFGCGDRPYQLLLTKYGAEYVACVMNLRMVFKDAITPASIRETNASVYVALSRKRCGVDGTSS